MWRLTFVNGMAVAICRQTLSVQLWHERIADVDLYQIFWHTNTVNFVLLVYIHMYFEIRVSV